MPSPFLRRNMSEVVIVNKALSLLGATRVSALSDNSLEAQSANNVYNESLKSILTECAWKFATKRVLLAKVDKKPAWVKNGMKNYFQLPSDLVAIIETSDPNARWEVEGQMILTDADTFGIEYVYFMTDSSKYPAYFIDAFACKLAADMCYELTNSNEKTMTLLELYKGEYLPLAKTKNSRAGSAPMVRDDMWVNSIFRSFYG